MYRKIEEELKKWKNDYKMPLMLVGARQTGKTYILEDFCKNNFNNYIYINLDKEENIAEIFEETIDPDAIIEKIEIIKNVVINPDDTILFLDEIQVSERAITSLKYFWLRVKISATKKKPKTVDKIAVKANIQLV